MILDLLLCSAIIIISVKAQEWDRPAFLQNVDEKDRVQFEDTGNDNEQMIYMDENIKEEITIAFLNYKGNSKPTITRFMEPSSTGNNDLGADFRRTGENENWELSIKKPQDYDDKDNGFRYAFEITASKIARRVYLFINNLDDERPVIIANQNPCRIEEDKPGLSDCTFTITDQDGVMNNYVKYTLSESPGIEHIFEIQNNQELQNGIKSWKTTLNVLQSLNYEITSSYLFNFTVEDSGGNKGSIKIIVEVIDIPNKPPVWRKIFSSKKFLEKQAQTIEVEAYDGDTGINNIINYEISSQWPELFYIGPENGTIYIQPINRDSMKQEIFTFELKAFEVPEPNSQTIQEVTIIVDDINDNIPEIKVSPTSISIPENTITTLELDIEICDIDLGENAMYSVSLADNKYNKAFKIVPSQAYQCLNFTISTVNSSLLDYENEDWQKIDIIINSQEKANINHHDSITVKVILENWNDESPIFEKAVYNEKILETIGINQYISTVFAVDRDIDDPVRHSLIGNTVKEMFSINETTGVINTKVENALDYEKQTVIIVQVQAEDSLGPPPYHKTIAELKIDVVDVNDEAPRIFVTPAPIIIQENQPTGTIVNNNVDITATDDDTTSNLKFEINWSKSYAVKNNNRSVPEEVYKECINVKTVYDPEQKHSKAILSIIELKKNNTPDYEQFDTLYLELVVIDTNQTILPNSDSARITINIDDVNDMWPEFVQSTIDADKRIIEHAPFKTTIASILATDADGPKFNKITYYLRVADDKTPNGWVDIDEQRGELFVNVEGKIDADIPIYFLNYIVTASDGDHETEANIKIYIVDTNDKTPELDINNFKANIELYEKSPNNETVQLIIATDGDRDPEYRTLWYTFNNLATDEVKDFFSIDKSTGRVYVSYKGDEILDRDYGTKEFVIPFTVGDNFNGGVTGERQNIINDVFNVKLLDKNDQPPKIKTKNVSTIENLVAGDIIGTIEASDDDEPGTNHSKINFEILTIEKDSDSGEVPPDLFTIEVEDFSSGKGTLIAGQNLKNYYGTYHISIKATDFGIDPQSSESIIDVIVQRYNFNPPRIISPEDGEAIYLSMRQSINQVLYKYDGTTLDPFKATDDQSEKWDIQFNINPVSNVNNMFTMRPAGKSMASLQLLSKPNYNETYQLQIIADCNCSGASPFTDTATIHIRFINKNTEPYFENNFYKLEFPENQTGVGIVKSFPEAYFNKQGENWPLFKIFYFLTNDISGCFEVEHEMPKITLKKMLDREKLFNFNVTVTASQSFAGNAQSEERSTLNILIEVIDVNDNSPYFNQSIYHSGVKPNDELYKTILEIPAMDLDSDDDLQFSIVPNSLYSEGEGITNIEKPFYISTQRNAAVGYTSVTGNIHLNFAVKTNMNGYFTFEVQAVDNVNNIAVATVKIYVVSQSSRTTFKFENNVDVVIPKEKEIKKILETELQYLCNIETIQKATDESGVPLETVTDIFMHFVNSTSNEPVNSDEIQQKAGNVDVFVKLKSEFLNQGLYLLTFNEGERKENMEEVLRAWLISSTVILGTVCILLIIAFIVKTRSLVRRLNKLSTTKFGSQESDLNRIGVAAPNTNKHAIEGSNPIYNNEKKITEFDKASIGSGDSDLIGIEDNPNFQYNKNISRKESVNSISKKK